MTDAAERIELVTAADDAYAPHVGAMLQSLFTTRASDQVIRINFLHRPQMSQQNLSKLAELCHRFGAEWRSIEVQEDHLPPVPVTSTYPQEAWYRLILPSLLYDLRRAVWLDADTLICAPIEHLWNIDLAGHVLAAVPNALSPKRRHHCRAICPSMNPLSYFSTGVLLMDLAIMREEDIESAFREELTNPTNPFLWADQDVYNPVLWSRYLKLPYAWNCTAGAYLFVRENIRVHGWSAYFDALRRPCVVHFTLPMFKPWNADAHHPYKAAYLRYRAAAGWRLDWPRVQRLRHRIKPYLPVWVQSILFSARRRQFFQLPYILLAVLVLLVTRRRALRPRAA